MFRFTRRGTLRNASYIPQAIGWATELNSYINEKYDADLKFGLEMFNELTMTWFFDAENLSDIQAFNEGIMQDQDYWTQVQKAADFWVEGSLEDRIVRVLG